MGQDYSGYGQNGTGYNPLGSVSDVKFADPTGQFANQLKSLQGASSGNSWMSDFLASTPGLESLAGPDSNFANQLKGLAADNAKTGGEAALAAMGGPNSGAGMAAFGDAYAKPFAEASAKLTEQALGNVQSLYGGALQGYNSTYNNAMNNASGMASKMGDMWTPTYAMDPELAGKMQKQADTTALLGGLGGNAASAAKAGATMGLFPA
jgi:hypothetical protein